MKSVSLFIISLVSLLGQAQEPATLGSWAMRKLKKGKPPIAFR